MIEELFCINYTEFDSNTHSVDVGDKVTNEMGLIYISQNKRGNNV